MIKPKLEGRTALVTGAAKGIGRCIALRLAERGVRIAVNYKSSADEAEEVAEFIRDEGGEAIAVQADVSDLSQVAAMIEKITGFWTNVDILVNNAGIIDDGVSEGLGVLQELFFTAEYPVDEQASAFFM